jgi:hypothetical protein
MLIGAIVAVCVLLLVLAFLFPRLSRHPERGVSKTLGAGQQAGGLLPGFLGRWAQKSFGRSRQATSKSASAGRRGRSKLPG